MKKLLKKRFVSLVNNVWYSLSNAISVEVELVKEVVGHVLLN